MFIGVFFICHTIEYPTYYYKLPDSLSLLTFEVSIPPLSLKRAWVSLSSLPASNGIGSSVGSNGEALLRRLVSTTWNSGLAYPWTEPRASMTLRCFICRFEIIALQFPHCRNALSILPLFIKCGISLLSIPLS